MDRLDDRAAEDLGYIVAACVEFDVPEQAAEPIAHFYREVMGLRQRPPRIERDGRERSGGNRSRIYLPRERPADCRLRTAITSRSTWRISQDRIACSANCRWSRRKDEQRHRVKRTSSTCQR